MDDAMVIVRCDGFKALVEMAARGYVTRILFPLDADVDDEGEAMRVWAEFLDEAVRVIDPDATVRYSLGSSIDARMHPFGGQDRAG